MMVAWRQGEGDPPRIGVTQAAARPDVFAARRPPIADVANGAQAFREDDASLPSQPDGQQRPAGARVRRQVDAAVDQMQVFHRHRRHCQRDAVARRQPDVRPRPLGEAERHAADQRVPPRHACDGVVGLQVPAFQREAGVAARHLPRRPQPGAQRGGDGVEHVQRELDVRPLVAAQPVPAVERAHAGVLAQVLPRGPARGFREFCAFPCQPRRQQQPPGHQPLAFQRDLEGVELLRLAPRHSLGGGRQPQHACRQPLVGGGARRQAGMGLCQADEAGERGAEQTPACRRRDAAARLLVLDQAAQRRQGPAVKHRLETALEIGCRRASAPGRLGVAGEEIPAEVAAVLIAIVAPLRGAEAGAAHAACGLCPAGDVSFAFAEVGQKPAPVVVAGQAERRDAGGAVAFRRRQRVVVAPFDGHDGRRQRLQAFDAEVVLEHVDPHQHAFAVARDFGGAPVGVGDQVVFRHALRLVEAGVEKGRVRKEGADVGDHPPQENAQFRFGGIERGWPLEHLARVTAITRQRQQVLLMADQREGREDRDVPQARLRQQRAHLVRFEAAASHADVRAGRQGQHVLDVGRVAAHLEVREQAHDAAEAGHRRDLPAGDVVVMAAESEGRPVADDGGLEAGARGVAGAKLRQGRKPPVKTVGIGAAQGDAPPVNQQAVAFGPRHARRRRRGRADAHGQRRQRRVGTEGEAQRREPVSRRRQGARVRRDAGDAARPGAETSRRQAAIARIRQQRG